MSRKIRWPSTVTSPTFDLACARADRGDANRFTDEVTTPAQYMTGFLSILVIVVCGIGEVHVARHASLSELTNPPEHLLSKVTVAGLAALDLGVEPVQGEQQATSCRGLAPRWESIGEGTAGSVRRRTAAAEAVPMSGRLGTRTGTSARTDRNRAESPEYIIERVHDSEAATPATMRVTGCRSLSCSPALHRGGRRFEPVTAHSGKATRQAVSVDLTTSEAMHRSASS